MLAGVADADDEVLLPLIEEPLHAYSIVPLPPVALEVRFTVPPTHIAPLLPIVAVGTASTVTVVV